MFNAPRLERPYRGYVVQGTSEPPGPYSDLWVPVATVLLKKPAGSVLQVERYRDEMLAYEDGDLAAWFGLGVAGICVDRCLSAACVLPDDNDRRPSAGRSIYFGVAPSTTTNEKSEDRSFMRLLRSWTSFSANGIGSSGATTMHFGATPETTARRWNSGKCYGCGFGASSRLASRFC